MDLLLAIVLFLSEPQSIVGWEPLPPTPCDNEYRASIDAINQNPWLTEGEKILYRQMAEIRLKECNRQAAQAALLQSCEARREWRRLLEYNGFPPNTPAFVVPANLPVPPAEWRPDFPYPPCW